MIFLGLLIFLPTKNPPGVGQICLGSNDSRINPHMRAKFCCSQTVVSKKGGYRQTERHTDRHTHTHKGTLQLYIVDVLCCVEINVVCKIYCCTVSTVLR